MGKVIIFSSIIVLGVSIVLLLFKQHDLTKKLDQIAEKQIDQSQAFKALSSKLAQNPALSARATDDAANRNLATQNRTSAARSVDARYNMNVVESQSGDVKVSKPLDYDLEVKEHLSGSMPKTIPTDLLPPAEDVLLHEKFDELERSAVTN